MIAGGITSGLWSRHDDDAGEGSTYAAPGEAKPIRLGEMGVHGGGTDLAIDDVTTPVDLSYIAAEIGLQFSFGARPGAAAVRR